MGILNVFDGLHKCQGTNNQLYIVRILSSTLIHKKILLYNSQNLICCTVMPWVLSEQSASEN